MARHGPPRIGQGLPKPAFCLALPAFGTQARAVAIRGALKGWPKLARASLCLAMVGFGSKKKNIERCCGGGSRNSQPQIQNSSDPEMPLKRRRWGPTGIPMATRRSRNGSKNTLLRNTVFSFSFWFFSLFFCDFSSSSPCPYDCGTQ